MTFRLVFSIIQGVQASTIPLSPTISPITAPIGDLYAVVGLQDQLDACLLPSHINCPVFGKRITKVAGFVTKIIAGHTVRSCSDSCLKRFEANRDESSKESS